jgi:hypothetical protein
MQDWSTTLQVSLLLFFDSYLSFLMDETNRYQCLFRKTTMLVLQMVVLLQRMIEVVLQMVVLLQRTIVVSGNE